MASGQQTYGGGGLSITGLIEHLSREAERLNRVTDGASIGARVQSQSPGTRYGQLYAPPSDGLAELRRQQAAFAQKQREIAWQNRWLAAPALAPVAVPFLVEGGAAVLGRGLSGRPPTTPGPLNLTGREAWQRAVRQAFSTAEKNRLRKQAGEILARANGISSGKMKADVHHSDPLEWAHLKPGVDPNRLANLWALRPEAHTIPTREMNAFTRSLQGRDPTPAELMREKLRVDRLVAPYIRRGGVPRSNKPRWKGGPI